MEGLGVNQFWQDRNVLVTGGTGLLGSWLVEMLLDRGANVTCLVRDAVPGSRIVSSGAISRVNVVHADLQDFAIVLRAVNEYETDTVFHLAAQTIVGTASRSVLSTFESNIRGTWNLLEACRSCGALVKRIAVASSDKAYGNHARLPYTEDAPLEGRFPYDVSKSCADLIALSYAASFGLPVAITRCGNLFGGGDLNYSRIVPGTIRSVLKGERPIIRSDGKLIRDYFYVEDAALAYLRLAEQLEPLGLTGQAFNFGTGQPLSVIEIVTAILRLMEREDLEPVILGQASHEILEQHLDWQKAHRVLAWSPAFTLDDALQRTIAWYRDRASGTPKAGHSIEGDS
ncbi:MAG: NAD-dependent epimerase/dehydratase family protein [Acidobacteriota bacterium]